MKSYFSALAKDTADGLLELIFSYLKVEQKSRGFSGSLSLSMYIRKDGHIGELKVHSPTGHNFRLTPCNWRVQMNCVERVALGMLNTLIIKTRGRIPELVHAFKCFINRKISEAQLSLTTKQLKRVQVGSYNRFLYTWQTYLVADLITLSNHYG